MRIPIIVQARMSSIRAPGKMLRTVDGKPLLGYMLDSLRRCRSNQEIIVATSDHCSDDPIYEYCGALQVCCLRGPLDDVAGRFAAVLAAKPADAFVRLSGDSPLIDYRLIDRAMHHYACELPDLVTNVRPRSFPRGQSVEVVSVPTFLAALPNITEPGDREHVTRFFYRDPERFKIVNFTAPLDYSGTQLSVDSEQDFDDFVTTVGRMSRPHWTYTYQDILALTTGVFA